MKIARSSDKPIEFQSTVYDDFTNVVLCIDAEEKQEETEEEGETKTTTYWEYKFNDFWFRTGALDLDDIKANPQNYINKVSVGIIENAKAKIKEKFLKLTEGEQMVSVTLPSSGTTVNVDGGETPIRNCDGLLSIGVFPTYFRLYDNSMVNVTKEDVEEIKKQIFVCGQSYYYKKWQAEYRIDNATSEKEIEQIVENF